MSVENRISALSRETDAAFPNISRNDLVRDLRERVQNPLLIDQCFSSLCGPAAFVYCLAKKKPEQYVQYVIDLFEKGEATIGQLKVKPRQRCREFRPRKGTPANPRITGVDWIALASLRDSANTPSDPKDPPNGYNNPDQQLAGITLPYEVAKWLSQAGFKGVNNNTNLVFDKGLDNLLEANRAHITGAMVCIFIGGKVVQNSSGGWFLPDHWAVLQSPVLINGRPAQNLISKGKKAINSDKTLLTQKIKFNIFSWEPNAVPINSKRPNLTVGEFLDYYYGYISAR